MAAHTRLERGRARPGKRPSAHEFLCTGGASSLAFSTQPVDSLHARAVDEDGAIDRAGRMKRVDERELRDELVKLRAEHRQLDDEIILLEGSSTADQLLVKRLKKRKLSIKDRITSIEDQLLPD